MKAVYLTGKKKAEVVEVGLPFSSLPECVVEVAFCGICGSDVHHWMWGGIGTHQDSYPKSLGHEVSGWLQLYEVNERVPVVVSPLSCACGECPRCREGRPNLCSSARYLGSASCDPGALCQEIEVQKSQVFQIPKSISLKDAVLIEPLAVALHAIHLARISVPTSVLVVGLGGIGRLIIEALRGTLYAQVKVFASDIRDYRVKLLPPYAVEYYGQEQVDMAFDAAGTDNSFQECLNAVRPGGTVVVVGIPPSDAICYNPHQARIKEVTIIHSRRFCNEFPKAIELAASGRVNLSGIVTHTFPLDKVQEAFGTAANYRDGVVRAVIDLQADDNG